MQGESVCSTTFQARLVTHEVRKPLLQAGNNGIPDVWTDACMPRHVTIIGSRCCACTTLQARFGDLRSALNVCRTAARMQAPIHAAVVTPLMRTAKQHVSLLSSSLRSFTKPVTPCMDVMWMPREQSRVLAMLEARPVILLASGKAKKSQIKQV